MNPDRKKFFTAVSVLVGTCIGAGVLGIPFVAAKAGFLIMLFYVLFLGGIVLLLNLYLGEVSLRTKGNHQLTGYAEKYLGKRAKKIMEFAAIFGIYSAIVAYLFGVGESLSFLIIGNLSLSLVFGVLFGIVMSILLWSGLKSLKKFEGIGVLIILILIITIFITFVNRINFGNLSYVNTGNLFLPFGVVLFALISFFAVPEVALILKKNKYLIKKVVFTSSVISVLFYILFSFVVVGFKGLDTPEIATFALGSVFVLLGVFTMFTSHLSLGNALEEDFLFDEHFKKKKSWVLSSMIPILIYIFISFFDFFSFTKILSIGGVVSGGTIAVLILLITKKAKKKGERKPEYSVPLNWFLILTIMLIFIIGVLREVFVILKNF